MLKKDNSKFQWPRSEKEVGQITNLQLSWLLSGLQINPKKYFKEVKIEDEELAI